MVGYTFFGDFDLASMSIWAFWFFFAYLIYYLQTENMREGYPLETEDGSVAPNQGPFPVPSDKTFDLPFGGGTLTVPSGQHGDRTDLALVQVSQAGGFPLVPTADPMAAGLGPAAWCPRADVPELNAEGEPKIVPIVEGDGFEVSAGRDPRGLAVLSREDEIVGYVTNMWIDHGEQEVRYLQYELEPQYGGGSRMVPIQMVRIAARWVRIRSLSRDLFAGVPTIASESQITKLEEEKVMGWYAGGTLYT